MKPTTIRTTVYLPRPEYLALRKRLLDEGKSFSRWVEEQVRAELER